jgi:hypothetical protein
MVEFIVISCIIILALIAGHVHGWISGKEYMEEKIRFEALFDGGSVSKKRTFTEAHRRAFTDAHPTHRQAMDDYLARQSLAFSQKQKQWIKVYDTEIND